MKVKIAIIVLISLAVAGCSNNAAGSVEDFSNSTAKHEMNLYIADAEWETELEKERLSKSVKICSLQDSVIYGSYSKAEYPLIDGIGRLDSGNLNAFQKQTLESFFKSFSELNEKQEPDFKRFFDSRYAFNSVFFWLSFKEILDENHKNISNFKNWYIIEPYKYRNLIKIPVRLYNDDFFTDIEILINESSFNFYQIDIIRWGKDEKTKRS